MIDNQTSSDFPKQVEAALLCEMWYVDGKADALRFAWDCHGDIAQLTMEVHEVEERILHPSESMKDPMSPGASPRIYQDGYLAGLKEIIRTLSGLTNESVKQMSSKVSGF